MNVIYQHDINQQTLADKKIAIIGYGSQGYAHSNNLKDSGWEPVVGLRKSSTSQQKAQAAGLKTSTVSEAVTDADIIMMLVPDENQADLYQSEIEQNLKPGATLLFAHGFNIHFGQIKPRADINVAMVAPKGPGHTVRAQYQQGSGVPCLVAIHQDPTGKTREQALAYADAIGGGRAGIIETSFKEETETDLFGEQAVLCGGTTALVQAGFETLTEAGYSPEMAYFECLHELKLIVDLMYEGGINTMRYSISNTAEYGDLTRGSRIVTEETKRSMKKILNEIQSGEFAEEYIADCKNRYSNLQKLRDQYADHPLETVGIKLRTMMPWIRNKPLVNQDLN